MTKRGPNDPFRQRRERAAALETQQEIKETPVVSKEAPAPVLPVVETDTQQETAEGEDE